MTPEYLWWGLPLAALFIPRMFSQLLAVWIGRSKSKVDLDRLERSSAALQAMSPSYIVFGRRPRAPQHELPSDDVREGHA